MSLCVHPSSLSPLSWLATYGRGLGAKTANIGVCARGCLVALNQYLIQAFR